MWEMVRNVSCSHQLWKIEVFANVFAVAAILFLCSKEARWITGVIMPVDAGVSRIVSSPSQTTAFH